MASKYEGICMMYVCHVCHCQNTFYLEGIYFFCREKFRNFSLFFWTIDKSLCVYRPKAGERDVGLPDPTGRDAFFGVTTITPPAAYHLWFFVSSKRRRRKWK